jgi:RNA polymerase sigma-70 factor (ECF subfamily)
MVPVLDNYQNPDPKRLRQDRAYRQKVFEYWQKRSYDDIYRYCSYFFGEAEADDLRQEVFQVVWTDLHKFKGPSTIESWIKGIARNKCRRLIRDQSRRRVLIKRGQEEIGRGLHHGAERSAENEAVDRLLTECLAKLENHDRLVLRLRYFRGDSYEDIAEAEGRSSNAVRQHVHRIIKQLRDWMHDDLD